MFVSMSLWSMRIFAKFTVSSADQEKLHPVSRPIMNGFCWLGGPATDAAVVHFLCQSSARARQTARSMAKTRTQHISISASMRQALMLASDASGELFTQNCMKIFVGLFCGHESASACPEGHGSTGLGWSCSLRPVSLPHELHGT